MVKALEVFVAALSFFYHREKLNMGSFCRSAECRSTECGGTNSDLYINFVEHWNSSLCLVLIKSYRGQLWAQCYKTFYCSNLLPFHGHNVILCYKATLPW